MNLHLTRRSRGCDELHRWHKIPTLVRCTEAISSSSGGVWRILVESYAIMKTVAWCVLGSLGLPGVIEVVNGCSLRRVGTLA